MLRFAASSIAAFTALTVLACDQAAGPPGTPDNPGSTRVQGTALQMQTGDSQYATVGRPVAVNPKVLVVNDSGRPVQGVTVNFAVTSGGGSASGTQAVSDSAGFATVGSWTLGSETGANTLTATIRGGDGTPIVFTAIAMCDCWKERAAVNKARRLAGSAVLGGKLYLIGGWNQRDLSLPVEEYDPASDTWVVRGTVPAQYKTGAVALNGELYLVAGEFSGTTPTPALASYDPVTGRLTQHLAPPTPRAQMEAAVVDGRLYVLGGLDGVTGILTTVEAFDPKTETWTTVAPMPRGRYQMAVAVVEGIIYVIGGQARGGPGTYVSEIVASVIAYDPKTDTWTDKASLPERLSSAAVGVVNGRIYVAGGTRFEWTGTDRYVMDPWTPNVYVYDPHTDHWSIQPPMHTPRYEATAAGLDSTVYVIGGVGALGAMLGNVEALKP
jgi:N-acetylneuraminic acid mutarotase